tara:strand:+ start:420 stop:791 length:372 start_codon:yes stop_codon:yes gene_type:complete
MKKFVVDCWDVIMDHNKNPLRHIPDLQVRHMVMQVLAFMWSAVFALYIAESVYAFGISAFAHVVFIGAVVLTVGTFKVAEKQPWRFGSYHSYGRSRGYVIYRDMDGNPYKVPLDKNDPGGEHE